MDEERLRDILKLKATEDLEILELWITGDVRPGRKEERWLNALFCRRR